MISDSQLVLQCQNLSKFYIEAGANISVLNDVSLNVGVGEKIAIIGITRIDEGLPVESESVFSPACLLIEIGQK